jgi:hypothetical protein
VLPRNISTSIQGKVNEDFDSGIQGALTSSRVFYGSNVRSCMVIQTNKLIQV